MFLKQSLFSSGFLNKILSALLICVMCVTCAAHVMLLDFNHPNNIWCQRPILVVQRQDFWA